MLIAIFASFFFLLNRPQRAKMRFWAKGKQGEKKTSRVKPDTHSEVSALFAGSDMIPAHRFPDGKNGQRVEIVFIICLLILKVFYPSSICNSNPLGKIFY